MPVSSRSVFQSSRKRLSFRRVDISPETEVATYETNA